MDGPLDYIFSGVLELSLVGGFLIMAAVLATGSLYWAFSRAEVGYEDKNGFHRGGQPSPARRKIRPPADPKRAANGRATVTHPKKEHRDYCSDAPQS